MTAAELDLKISVDKAIAAARGVPHFVFVPADAPAPVAAALEAYAIEVGKQVLVRPVESAARAAVSAALASGRPAIEHGDDAGFLENLQQIATGRMVMR